MKKTRSLAVSMFVLAMMLIPSVQGTADSKTEVKDVKFTLKTNGIQADPMAVRSIRSKKMVLGFRFFGGTGNLFGMNNFNDSHEGWNDWYSDFADYQNSYGSSLDFVGPLDPLKFAFLGGMEVFVNFNPYLEIGLGVGYIIGSKKSGPVGVNGNFYAFGTDWPLMIERTFTQKVSAIPIQFTIYGGLPLGNRMKLAPYFGVGLYLGRIALEESYNIDDGFWYYAEEGQSNWKTHSSPMAFGFHGGLNFEFLLNNNFGLFLGLGALSASFVDLIGDLEWNYDGYDWWGDYEDSGTDENLKLWFLEEEGGYYAGRWYKIAYLTDKDPNNWPGVRNVEPGKISLSQVRLMIGFVIYLNR